MWKPIAIAAAALALGACATIPQPLAGDFPATTPNTAHGAGAEGARVRWGGELILTEPEQQQTCFYVLSHELDKQARPKEGGISTGRFVACKDGFYEPEEFAKGREITVTGTVHGTITRKVGEYDYTYPRVVADTIYLWAKRPRYVYVNDPFYYDPFWGPWGPWNPWYGPYWAPPPRVIVVPQNNPPPKKN